MAAPRIDRRLTAVLAADVVGYSRLVQRDERGITPLHCFLELGAEAWNVSRKCSVVLGAAAPQLHSVSAEVIPLFAVAVIESRQIDVFAADAVIVVDRTVEKFGHKAEHVEADLFGEIPSDDIGRVTDSVRIFR